MNNVSIIKVGDNSYNIKDETARNTANQANTKAENAQTTANSALSIGNNADNKITNSKIIGTYDMSTETLDISLEIGGN